jgi:hypothetical protein
VPISPGNGSRTGPLIQVASDGTVYVLWVDQPKSGGPILKISISHDGGKTFRNQGVTVASYDTQDPTGTLPGSELGTFGFPSFSLAPDGTLYVAWPRRTNEHSVTMLATSSDGGFTWSAPTIAADIPGRSSFFVALATDPNGKVNLVFNALDDVPPGTPLGAGVVSYDTYWAQSSNGGASFSAPLKISTGASDPDVSVWTDFFPDFAFQFIGDYISAVADGSHVYTVWTDTRNGSPCAAMDDFMLGQGPAPDVITGCPSDWDNADIYIGTVSY